MPTHAKPENASVSQKSIFEMTTEEISQAVCDAIKNCSLNPDENLPPTTYSDENGNLVTTKK